MALPTAYLTSTKNLEAIFNAMRSAKAPPKFTQRFLEDLGFKSAADRLAINVFKGLGLLSPDGAPTQRYYEFLNQSQSGGVLAQGLEEAYADIYQLHRDAHDLPRAELVGKIKTLTQGQASDAVVAKMASTFTALAKLADFDAARTRSSGDEAAVESGRDTDPDGEPAEIRPGGEGHGPPPLVAPPGALNLGGLVYNIELHLPDSRDPAVYEALFRALKTHLLS